MKTPAWQRSEGKNPKGGLNAKGRASYNAETGGELKAPVKSGDTLEEQVSWLAWAIWLVQSTRMVNRQDCFFRLKHGVHPQKLTQRQKLKLYPQGTKRRQADDILRTCK